MGQSQHSATWRKSDRAQAICISAAGKTRRMSQACPVRTLTPIARVRTGTRTMPHTPHRPGQLRDPPLSPAVSPASPLFPLRHSLRASRKDLWLSASLNAPAARDLSSSGPQHMPPTSPPPPLLP